MGGGGAGETRVTKQTGSVDLVYIDPPFNTGRQQTRRRLKTVHDEEGGDRTGFQGKRYRTVELGRTGYADARVDSLLDRAARTADPSVRQDLLREVERTVVVDEAVILPVYYFAITNLYDDRVWEGLQPDALNSLDLRRVRRRSGGVAR